MELVQHQSNQYVILFLWIYKAIQWVPIDILHGNQQIISWINIFEFRLILIIHLHFAFQNAFIQRMQWHWKSCPALIIPLSALINPLPANLFPNKLFTWYTNKYYQHGLISLCTDKVLCKPKMTKFSPYLPIQYHNHYLLIFHLV